MRLKYEKVFILMVVLLILLVPDGHIAGKTLDSAEFKVSVTVPVMQQLITYEPVVVSFTYPWAGADEGQALEFTDVGRISVQSNAKWAVQIETLSSSGFDVYVRPSNAGFGNWNLQNEFGNSYSGERGVYDISWDIKVVANKNLNTIPQQVIIPFAVTVSAN